MISCPSSVASSSSTMMAIKPTLFAVCALGFLQSAFCATQHESSERDSSSFYYDPDTHYLVMALKTTCFMVALTTHEQDHVHVNLGLAQLELTMLREWIGKLPETKVYHDSVHLPRHVSLMCNDNDIFILERHLAGSQASSPVPIVQASSTPQTGA